MSLAGLETNADASVFRAVNFTVIGKPQTQGSKVAGHIWRPNYACTVWLREDIGPALEEWRALVCTSAKRAMGQDPPLTGPVKISLTFWFQRPKSHTAKQRRNPFVSVQLRDIDKLQRAIFDALVDAAVLEDDGQIAVVAAQKLYGDKPGVWVSLEGLA